MDFVDDRLRAEFVFTVRPPPRPFTRPPQFPQQIVFVWRCCMGAQGAWPRKTAGFRPGQNPNAKGECGCGESFNV
jgi:hypothetical protein